MDEQKEIIDYLEEKNFEALEKLGWIKISAYLTKEIAEKYSKDLYEYINNSDFNSNSFYYFNEVILNSILKYDIKIYKKFSRLNDIDEEIIISNLDEIIMCIKEEDEFFVPSSFRRNKYVLEKLLQQKDFSTIKKLSYDESSEEIIKENLDIITSHIESTKEVNKFFKQSKTIFDYYSKKDNSFELLVQFNEELLDDEFINHNLSKLVDYILGREQLDFKFKENIILFNEFIKIKRIDIALQFSKNLISDDFINNNLELILDYVEEQNLIPRSIQGIEIIERNLLKRGRLDLLIKDFNSTIINDEFINNNLEAIIVELQKGYTIPCLLMNNTILFNKLIELGRIDLVVKFDKNLLTDEFINSNLEILINYIITSNKVPHTIRKNKTLFTELVKQKRIDLALEFNNELITDDFIQKYINEIIQIISNSGKIPESISNNKLVFNEIIKTSQIGLAFMFDESLFNLKFIQENFDQICNFIENNNMTKYLDFFTNYNDLVIMLVENDRFDLLLTKLPSLNFSTTIIIDKYFDKFVEGIKQYNSLTYNISHNYKLFEYFIKNKEYEIASKFDIEAKLTDEFLNEYFEKSVSEYGKMLNVFNNKYVLRWTLKNKKYNYLSMFSSSCFDTIIINEFDIYSIIKNYYHGEVPEELLNLKILLKTVIEHQDYRMAIKFINQQDALQDENTKKEYAKILGISVEELDNKINTLLKKNDEVLNTLKLELLGNDYNISLTQIELFAPYTDIQAKILSIDKKYLPLFIKMINYLDSSHYDICPIINNFLDNYSSYIELLNSINPNSITEEEFHNLLILLQNKNNYLNITNIKNLNNNNYKKLKNEYFTKIEKRIKNNDIGIEELKEYTLLKRFGLSMEQTTFLINRYCKNIELISKSNLSKEVINILESINYIYNCQNIEELTFYFKGETVNFDFYTAVSLESRIRKEFAKLYSKSLYKLNPNDEITETLQSNNPKIYKLLQNTSYNGKKPKFYLPRDDFYMQIHVLGAYSYYERPKNFKEDWNMPKISSHGICTSYISSGQIANARDNKGHPIYGFSSYEDSALLLEGNLDLVSSRANTTFATSYTKTGNSAIFFPPKNMIDYTRHTHNEIVIERKNLDKSKSTFKRMPDYIVYIVDDINNEENFSENNTYYQEIIQASVDHNIPIVIIDRLYYAKKETSKCEKLLEEICEEKAYNKISNLIVTYMNNMVGCRKYEKQEEKEYHKYFTKEGFEKIYSILFEQINKLDENNKKIFLLELYKAILNEYNKINIQDKSINKDNFYDSLALSKKLEQIQELANKIGLNFDLAIKKQIDINYLIYQYYTNSNEEIKRKLSEDISKGTSIEDIIYKINTGKYENNDRGVKK